MEIKVPVKMNSAFDTAWAVPKNQPGDCLKAVLEYQAKNPILPTDEELDQIGKKLDPLSTKYDICRNLIAHWIRIMYEDPIPEAIKDLIAGSYTKESILEAYNRGKAGK